MSIILTDAAAATYTFPANFTVRGIPFKTRSSFVDIAYSAGSKNKGDLKTAMREIIIEGIVGAADAASFETLRNTIYAWLFKTDLKLSFIAGKHFKVKCITNVSPSFFEGGFLRVAKLSFTCQCEDPFQYYDAVSSDNAVIAASPTTWSITNAGAYDVYPVITITNSANNTDFILENITDANRSFEYIDAACLNTLVTVIDNTDGTVFMNGANGVSKFTGNWLRLLPGVNSIKYTGAVCNIDMNWYQREL